jgi:SAM-dependent methyltransferase
MYQKEMTAHSFPYSLSDAETLNVDAYRCSNCSASDRDRLFVLFIETFLLPAKGQITMLDIAPARSLRKYLEGNPHVNYRCADLFMDDVDDRIDVTDMYPYKDEMFDFLICSHVLEHVQDDIKAMRELFRVLKKGGCAIVMVPLFTAVKETDEDPTVTDVHERWRRFGQDDHVRLYSKKDFLARLESVGFKVSQKGVSDFGTRNFDLYGISAKSVLYIISKES